MTVNGTDEFLVNRAGTTYTQEQQTIMASLQNDDLLLVNRAGTTYTITGQEFVESVIDPLELNVTLAPTDAYTSIEITAIPIVSGGKMPDGGYTFTYQWVEASDAAGTNKTNIVGENTDTFTPSSLLIGKFVGCEVSTTDDLGTTATGVNYVGPISLLATPPVISDVTLSEIGDGVNRFTDKEFPFTTTMAIDGEPAPTYGLKAKLSGTTFDFNIVTDTITDVEPGGSDVCSTDTIESVGEVSFTPAVGSYSKVSGGDATSDAFTNIANAWDGDDATWAYFDSSSYTGGGGTQSRYSWVFGAPIPCTELKALVSSYSGDPVTFVGFNGQPGKQGSDRNSEGPVMVDFSDAITDGFLHSFEIGDKGSNYGLLYSIYVNGKVLTNPFGYTELTFPTTNGFDCFEPGDVVQGGWDQRQLWRDYITRLDGNPANSPDRAFDADYDNNTTNGGSGIGLLFTPPIPLTGELAIAGANQGKTSTIQVTHSGGTDSFTKTTTSDDWSVLGTFTGVTSISLENDVDNNSYISGIRLNGKRLTDSDIPGPSPESVKVVSKDTDAKTITVDGGYWKNVNDSQVWSTTLTGATATPAANAFDGNLDTYAQGDAGTTLTFNPATPIPYTNSVRVHTQYSGDVKLNPGTGSEVVADAGGVIQWTTLVDGASGTITQITGTATNKPTWDAIEVDGKILIDAVDESQTWSNNLTGAFGATPAANAFDGNTSLSCESAANGTLTYTGTINGNLKLYRANGSANDDGNLVNVGAGDVNFPRDQWVDFGTVNISSFTITDNGTLSSASLSGVMVDDKVLVDPGTRDLGATQLDKTVVYDNKLTFASNQVLDALGGLDVVMSTGSGGPTPYKLTTTDIQSVTTESNWNQDQTWSTSIGAGGSWDFTAFTAIFDGDETTGGNTTGSADPPNRTLTGFASYFPNGSGPYTVEFITPQGDLTCQVNGDAAVSPDGNNVWTQAGIVNQIDTITLTMTTGAAIQFNGLRVNGKYLVDSGVPGATGETVLTFESNNPDLQYFLPGDVVQGTWNQDNTWSDYASGSEYGGAEKEKAFDGILGTPGTGAGATFWQGDQPTQIEFPSPMSGRVRLFCGGGIGVVVDGSAETSYPIEDKTWDWNDYGDLGTFTKLEFFRGGAPAIAGIEIGDFLLVDAGITGGSSAVKVISTDLGANTMTVDGGNWGSNYVRDWSANPTNILPINVLYGFDGESTYTTSEANATIAYFEFEAIDGITSVKFEKGNANWGTVTSLYAEDSDGTKYEITPSGNDVTVAIPNKSIVRLGGLHSSGSTMNLWARVYANGKILLDGAVAGDNYVEYETQGGLGKVVKVDADNNEAFVTSGGTSDNRFIGDNKAGTAFVIEPESAVPIVQDFAYGQLSIVSNKALLTGFSRSEPAPLPIPSKDYSIQFPSTLTSGNAPDADLPVGTCIAAIVEAKNDIGESEKESNCYLPADVNPAGAAGPITATTPTTLTVDSNANLGDFSLGDNLVMVDENNDISSYTIVSDSIVSITSQYSGSADVQPSIAGSWEQVLDGDACNTAATCGMDTSVQTTWTFDNAITITADDTFEIYNSGGSNYSNIVGWSYDNNPDSFTYVSGSAGIHGGGWAWDTLNVVGDLKKLRVGASPGFSITAYRLNGQVLDLGNKTLTLASDQDLAYFRTGDVVQGSDRTGELQSQDFGNNKFTGTITGATWQTTIAKAYGGAADWTGDATAKNIVIPSYDSFKVGTGDFTFAWWSYLDSANKDASGNSYLFDQGTQSGKSRFAVYRSNGTMACIVSDQVYGDVIPSASYDADTWVYFAIIRSGGTLRGYVNGVQVSSRSATADLQNDAAVGKEPTVGNTSGGSQGQYNWRGYLQDMLIYKKAISPQPPTHSLVSEVSGDLDSRVDTDQLSLALPLNDYAYNPSRIISTDLVNNKIVVDGGEWDASNQSQVWSDPSNFTTSSSFIDAYPTSNAFDGDMTTSCYVELQNSTINWDASSFGLSGTVRVRPATDTPSNKYTITVNGSSVGTSGDFWSDPVTVDSLSSISVTGISADGQLCAIEVNGQLLVDAVDDSQVWSDGVSANMDYAFPLSSSTPAESLFDGTESLCQSSDGTPWTITFATPVSYSQSVEVETYFEGNVIMNEGLASESTSSASNVVETLTLASGSGTLSTIKFEGINGSYPTAYWVKVDGKVLVDTGTDRGIGDSEVAFGPVTGTGVFDSTNGTDTMTLSSSNDRWIDNSNRLSKDFYVRDNITALNADNAKHVAMQQAISDAFDAFPGKVATRQANIQAAMTAAQAALTAEQFALIQEEVDD